MRRHLIRRIAAWTTAILLLAGCAPGGIDAADVDGLDGPHVRVQDNRFSPESLEAKVDETVTWVWEGRASHDVVGAGFDSGIQNDGTFEHRFTDPGTYEYECTLHPGMTGRVTVVDT